MSQNPSLPWWKQLSGYHWFVLIVASAAWFFDCLDQRIFSLARVPALTSLMKNAADVPNFGKWCTAAFLVGWGVGGMIFGAMGDRYGRARMLTITILIYSAFTGLSFVSRNEYDFTAYRFLTGLGVGGVFGLAVSLIAETVPSGARAQSLALLQVLSTIGNISAGLVHLLITKLEASHVLVAGQGWRWMFLIGALPAAMVIFTGKKLKEPASWLQLKQQGRLPSGGIFAPYVGLLSNARWRKNLIVGTLIASTGVVGLWAIGEYAVDLQPKIFKAYYQTRVAATDLKEAVDVAKFWAYISNMVGAGIGMAIFARIASSLGRRTAFLIGFSAALIVTVLVYWKMNTPFDAYWMMFLMGAAQLSVFAGFAIYLPELFPSRLRSTGTSFCYNFGRFAAAAGSFFSAQLAAGLFGQYADPLPQRYSAMVMCAIFLIGIITLAFAPETKGQPLPEE